VAHLTKTSTRFLSEDEPFDHERDLEAFIISNPSILAYSEDRPPNDLLSVYIIGRQDSLQFTEKETKKGRTDITCLIWDSKEGKYRIWIYELKKGMSESPAHVDQLLEYLNAIGNETNHKKREEFINEAIKWVSEILIEENYPIRGALCAQDFHESVYQKINDENEKRKNKEERLEAVKINKFRVGNDIFVVVDRVLGADKPYIKSRDYSLKVCDAVKNGSIKKGTKFFYDKNLLPAELEEIRNENPDELFTIEITGEKNKNKIVKWLYKRKQGAMLTVTKKLKIHLNKTYNANLKVREWVYWGEWRNKEGKAIDEFF